MNKTRWSDVTAPLAIDLFCGLGGWTDGLLAEGYRVVGFDNERHGDGYGDGYGSGYGDGSGDGDGYGSGYGDGDGDGYGSGYAYGEAR